MAICRTGVRTPVSSGNFIRWCAFSLKFLRRVHGRVNQSTQIACKLLNADACAHYNYRPICGDVHQACSVFLSRVAGTIHPSLQLSGNGKFCPFYSILGFVAIRSDKNTSTKNAELVNANRQIIESAERGQKSCNKFTTCFHCDMLFTPICAKIRLKLLYDIARYTYRQVVHANPNFVPRKPAFY